MYAVVNGFTQRGLEGQSVSIENGIHRHFDFTDMTRYIGRMSLPTQRCDAR